MTPVTTPWPCALGYAQAVDIHFGLLEEQRFERLFERGHHPLRARGRRDRGIPLLTRRAHCDRDRLKRLETEMFPGEVHMRARERERLRDDRARAEPVVRGHEAILRVIIIEKSKSLKATC